MSSPLQDSIRDLTWSVWTELGVSGVIRNHQRTVIDPEPLVIAAPMIFPLDPRLRDQVFGWCASHADRISVSRLQGLLRASPPRVRETFAAFAATLRHHENVSWPHGEAEPWLRAPEVRPPPVPVERPALLRLRLRALCGVGARADVICELIARTGGWFRASDLADEGYSKRTIAVILGELAAAGVVRSQRDANALTFQSAHPDAFDALLQTRDLAFPRWSLVTALTHAALELEELEARPDPVRRVEAHKVRERLASLADLLWLDAPPITRGNSRAWWDTMRWVSSQLEDLAAGTSAALGILKVRVAILPGGREAWVWLHRTAVGHGRLDDVLRQPDQAAAGVRTTAAVAAPGGWTAYQLIFHPELDEQVLRMKIEHLVHPMKVGWRRMTPAEP